MCKACERAAEEGRLATVQEIREEMGWPWSESTSKRIASGAPIPKTLDAPKTLADMVADTKARLEREVLMVDKRNEVASEAGLSDDDLRFEGTSFILPATLNGDVDKAISFLAAWKEQQSTPFSFTREFLYRPWDGAAAFDRAMRRMFGTSGIGEPTPPKGLFGSATPPSLITINVGHNVTAQVPWGRVKLDHLDATIDLDSDDHPLYGQIFMVRVTAPRRRKVEIEKLFGLVEEELRTRSIYKGKAIAGGDDPAFLDVDTVDPRRVVYSPDVLLQLETSLWSVLRWTDEMRRNGIPLKRSVLVEGPYGTGKTLAGMLTAQVAAQNGWTFILARPGQDDLNDILRTAQLYAPAVVWYEDVDVVAQGNSDQQISSLLDALDGVSNKGSEIVAGFTTNHVDKIQKGVLRPGRLDAVIHVGGLDHDGLVRLIEVAVPANILDRGVDFDKVADSFEGFLPAFAKEAIDRAVRYSISRNGGKPDVITTDDLVNAANGLRPQLELMLAAQEGAKRPDLGVALGRAVVDQLPGVRMVSLSGADFATLAPPSGSDS